jgi:hypothetical protein
VPHPTCPISCVGPVRCSRLATAISKALAVAWCTISETRRIPARSEYLLTTGAAKIRPFLSAGLNIAVAEPLLHVRVTVSDASAMGRIVLPVVTDPVDVDGAIQVDVVPAPTETPAPIVSAHRPAPT